MSGKVILGIKFTESIWQLGLRQILSLPGSLSTPLKKPHQVINIEITRNVRSWQHCSMCTETKKKQDDSMSSERVE